MTKRLLSLLLAVVTVVMLAFPGVASVSAEDYPNTHVNTGDQRYDIVQIALTQLGYTESTTDKSGSNGYTKYGEFYGHPYADWCGCFVNWCARKANVSTSVLKKTGLTKPSMALCEQVRSMDKVKLGDRVGRVISRDAMNKITHALQVQIGAIGTRTA